ncbi:MAG: thioesterase [Chitinophagales bacterium]|nr:MAG: thioesterase [Chitinophagales bacterium]
MNNPAGFRHCTDIQIRFADIDSMGHVNNARYLTYIESARIAYFKQVLQTGMHSSPGFILAKATVDFLLPLLFDDKIQVYTRCSRIGTKSFDLEYEIVKMQGNGVITAARAHTVLVAYDYAAQKSIPIPSAWKQIISEFENKAF